MPTKEQQAAFEAAEAERRAPGFGITAAEMRAWAGAEAITTGTFDAKPKRKSRLGKALAAWVESCGPQEHQPIHGLTTAPNWSILAQPNGTPLTTAGYYGQSPFISGEYGQQAPPNNYTLNVTGSLTVNGYQINPDPVK